MFFHSYFAFENTTLISSQLFRSIMDGNSSQICPDPLLHIFRKSMANKLLRVNGLMLGNAILMGIVVSLGVCAPRARRNPLLGFLLLGGSTLFLPIVSNVAGTIGNDMYSTSTLYKDDLVVAAKCQPGLHVILILVWTVVVVTIGVNTSNITVADAREGRTVQPSLELLLKAIWVSILVYLTLSIGGFVGTLFYIGKLLGNEKATGILTLVLIISPAMVLPCSKMVGKCISFYFSKRSLGLGRGTKLVVAYMAQLREGQKNAPTNGVHTPPELIIKLASNSYKLVEQPRGFSLRRCQNTNGADRSGTRSDIAGHNNNGDRSRREMKLVTLDKVWEQTDGSFLQQEHKDLCFSNALFKLLRCRFARYTVFEAGFMEVQFFFRQEYLSGNQRYDSVFRLIAHELSFINSYYNSSLPIYCSYPSVFLLWSLLSIGYCSFMFVFMSRALKHIGGREQVVCFVWCPGQSTQQNGDFLGTEVGFGNTFFDVIPIYLVLTVLLISELKDLVYYICSNWIKVSLICCYIQPTCWPTMKKCIRVVVNCCRWEHVNSWGDKMSQCSILVHRPWWKLNPYLWRVPLRPGYLISLPFWHFLGFPEEESVKDLEDVKKSVFKALKKYLTIDGEGAIKAIPPPSPPVTVCGNDTFFTTCGCNSVAATILVWHIATDLFGRIKDQEPPADPEGGTENLAPQSSDPHNKTAAVQLSRYCAYLVACCPELLPDEDEWCKELYGGVLKHAHPIVRGAGKGAEFLVLVQRFREAYMQDHTNGPEADQQDGTNVPEADQGANVLEANQQDGTNVWEADRLDGTNILEAERASIDVIKNGVRIAERLVDKNIGWEQLADFWSEILLYIAPSENLDGHAEAIARGGEMVTLLWALLAHAGVVERPEDSAGTSNAGGDASNTSAQA